MNPKHGGKILKILVTGTAGFIGFHLADKLTQKGYEVIGLDVINSYYDQKVKFGRLNNSGILENKLNIIIWYLQKKNQIISLFNLI